MQMLTVDERNKANPRSNSRSRSRSRSRSTSRTRTAYEDTVPMAHEAAKRHPSKSEHGPEYYISEQVHAFLKAMCRDMQEKEEPVNAVMYKYEDGQFSSPNGYLYDTRRVVGTRLQRGWFCAVVVLPINPVMEFDYHEKNQDNPYLEDCVQECCAVTGVDTVLITNYNHWLLVHYEGIIEETDNTNSVKSKLFKHERKVKFVGISGPPSDQTYDRRSGYQHLAKREGYRPVINVIRTSMTKPAIGLQPKVWKVVADAHKRKLRNQKPQVFES